MCGHAAPAPSPASTGTPLANCGATEGGAWSVARGSVASERPLGATQARIAACAALGGGDVVEVAGVSVGGGRRMVAAQGLADRGLVRLDRLDRRHGEPVRYRVLPARAPAPATA